MNYLYSCEKCFFFSNNITNYNQHLETKRHININECKYECKKCKKKYKYNTGLSKHKKICNEVTPENTTISNEVITQFKDEIKEQNQQHQKEIKEQNQRHQKDIEELKKLIIELTKKEQLAPITNNDNKLNINLFLNEKCNNAINMIDFVKSIVFELKDFENLLDKGYIENKTNIILENLNKLTVYERPLHYETQQKVIHIRDEDKWKKETENNKPILKNAIDYVNESEYTQFFEVYCKKTNGDVREDKDFETIKTTLIKSETDSTNNVIISTILEDVKL